MREAMERAGGRNAGRGEGDAALGGTVVGLLTRHPLEAAAGTLAAALAIGIVVNALALQTVVHHHLVRRAPAVPPVPISRPMARPPAPPAVAPLQPQEAPVPAREAPAPGSAPAAAEAESSLVAAIQTELKRRGVYREKVDGALGPKTEAAILSFQVATGMNPTGRPSEALLHMLRGR